MRERQETERTGTPSTSNVHRAAHGGQTAWWLNAVLAHTEPPDQAVEHLDGDVLGLTPDGHRLSWSLALGDLRRKGVRHVRLAIVEPGDPVGIPGPAPVTQAAVASGLALVADPGDVVLIPDDAAPLWRAMASSPVMPPQIGTVAEARGLLREAMHELTTTFSTLDPDAEALAGLARYRAFVPPRAPHGISERAREVAADALRVWWLADEARELCRRREIEVPTTLRHLHPTARRAAATAFSEPPDATA